MPKRFEYENKFCDYPDLLTMQELTAVLGDISAKKRVSSAPKQRGLYLCETPQTRKKLMILLDVKSKKTFSVFT